MCRTRLQRAERGPTRGNEDQATVAVERENEVAVTTMPGAAAQHTSDTVARMCRSPSLAGPPPAQNTLKSSPVGPNALKDTYGV